MRKYIFGGTFVAMAILFAIACSGGNRYNDGCVFGAQLVLTSFGIGVSDAEVRKVCEEEAGKAERK